MALNCNGAVSLGRDLTALSCNGAVSLGRDLTALSCNGAVSPGGDLMGSRGAEVLCPRWEFELKGAGHGGSTLSREQRIRYTDSLGGDAPQRFRLDTFDEETYMANPASCEVSQGIRTHRLEDFVGGWLVGHFSPTLIANHDVEVAVKHYPAGALEARHYHAIATEYTVIAAGRVRMNGREYTTGEIIQINPGQSTDFEALEPTTTVVLKTPSVPNDKFIEADESRKAPDA